MSNRKAIRVLILGILLLTGIHVLLSLQGIGHTLVTRTTLLEPSAQQGATRLVLARRGAPATVLERTEDAWRIVEPYTARAETSAVRRLLDALTFTPIRTAYSEQDLLKFGRTRADYGLEEPALAVTLTVDGTERTVGFGILTPVNDGVFVSVAGDAPVYVVETNVLAAADLPSEGFRQRALCPAGVAAVDAFDLKRGTGSFQSFRLREGAWSKLPVKDGEAAVPASAVKVRALLSDLDRARAAAFVWPVGATNEPELATATLLAGYGLAPETAVTVTLHGLGVADQQISFGREATDGKVYALVQNAGAIVTVDGALCDFVRETDFTDTRLFPFEAAGVTRVSLTDEGVNYLLAKNANGAWMLDAPIAAAADTPSVEALLERLLALSAADRDEKGLTVSLQTNAPPESVARDAVLDGASLADLRSREILRTESGAVRRLVVTTAAADKPATVVYDKDLRVWKVEASDKPGTVDAAAIEELLAALNPLRAEKIVKLKVTAADLHRYGLDTPSATVAVDSAQEGTLRRNILIGEKAQGGAFATLGASDAIFILSDATVKALTTPFVTEDNSN